VPGHPGRMAPESVGAGEVGRKGGRRARLDVMTNSGDPHIHVEGGPLRARAAERNLLASTFGLVGELPAEVTTACGLRAPFVMTSAEPDTVTCLPCRKHAAGQHRLFAEQVATLGTGPASPFTGLEAARAAAAHHDLARRFDAPP
jgi:hypothetical protein